MSRCCFILLKGSFLLCIQIYAPKVCPSLGKLPAAGEMDPRTGLRYHALKLLSGRPHSSAELNRRLALICERRRRAKRPATAELYKAVPDCKALAREVVNQLSSEGLVNDTEYADWHVRMREEYKHKSHSIVAYELRTKGIAPEVAAEAMNGYSNVEQCRLAAKKKIRLPRDKLQMHLVRKGFPFAIVKKVMDELQLSAAGEDPDSRIGGGARVFTYAPSKLAHPRSARSAPKSIAVADAASAADEGEDDNDDDDGAAEAAAPEDKEEESGFTARVRIVGPAASAVARAAATSGTYDPRDGSTTYYGKAAPPLR